MDAPPHNLRPRYNVCPTDPVDVVTVMIMVQDFSRSPVLRSFHLAQWNTKAAFLPEHPAIREIHDRMPVFLTEQQFTPWLSGEAGAGILKPAPNDFLQRWPVSKRVNSSKADADDTTLIADWLRDGPHQRTVSNRELAGGVPCLDVRSIRAQSAKLFIK
jgi:putative SOS response-associated peptidase YedK